MTARIIDFPAARVVRHPDLIDALEKLDLIDQYDVSGDRVKMVVAVPMRDYWEAELVRLGGVPRDRLTRDGLDTAPVEGAQ